MATKMAELLIWAKGPHHNGNRDTADSLQTVMVSQRRALKIARAWENNEFPKEIPMELHCAVGHGVTIKYAIGKVRVVRSYE